jgi:hypothetical protein
MHVTMYVIVTLPVHTIHYRCIWQCMWHCPWLWHCPCIRYIICAYDNACDNVRDGDTARAYDTLHVHKTMHVTLSVHVAVSVIVTLPVHTIHYMCIRQCMWHCPCLWQCPWWWHCPCIRYITCAYDNACDTVPACGSVRHCDTAYVRDMLPHSSGNPFRDLLDSTGWLCYSTLVSLPILSKRTGDTVPAGPTDATDSSLPPLMVNPLQRPASILSHSLTTLPVSVTRRTRDKWQAFWGSSGGSWLQSRLRYQTAQPKRIVNLFFSPASQRPAQYSKSDHDYFFKRLVN